MARRYVQRGFTLIELSIVLVIIGLIVGGILVGQDLIRAAGVRATVTQIEKYNTAVNTFRGKYNYLPGDIPNPDATNFGFAARGQYAGEGDGNGVIEGNVTNTPSMMLGTCEGIGETAVFWVDLSTAALIDGGFNTATSTGPPSSGWGNPVPTTLLGSFFPAAKLGQGNYVYVYSGGSWNGSVWSSTSINYYGISAITSLNGAGYYPVSTAALTVQQAYNIDKKIDDGLPQSGNVTTQYLDYIAPIWPGVSPGSSASPSPSTCYDTGGSAANPMQYSTTQNGGAGVNCALSFRFQ